MTEDWDYLGPYVVSRCDGCYRGCSVIHRDSSGTPDKCPYGFPGCDFYDVGDSE